jgi:hypothetical protein
MFSFHCYSEESASEIEKRRKMWINVCKKENITPENPDMTCTQLARCVKYGLSWLLDLDFDPILEITLASALKAHGEAIQGGGPSLHSAETDTSINLELAQFPFPTPDVSPVTSLDEKRQ